MELPSPDIVLKLPLNKYFFISPPHDTSHVDRSLFTYLRPRYFHHNHHFYPSLSISMNRFTLIVDIPLNTPSLSYKIFNIPSSTSYITILILCFIQPFPPYPPLSNTSFRYHLHRFYTFIRLK